MKINISDVMYWISCALVWLCLIYATILRIRTKRVIKDLKEISDERNQAYLDFGEEMQKAYNDFTNQYAERQNALSKENNKLREENEEMKERLNNLGFKDL